MLNIKKKSYIVVFGNDSGSEAHLAILDFFPIMTRSMRGIQ